MPRTNPAAARILYTDDLDAAIAAASGTDLEILLAERSARVALRTAKLAAIDALWTEYGIDCDDVRSASGSLVLTVDGLRVWTQGGTTRTSEACLAKQSGNARTRRWYGGNRSEHFFGSPEEALLAALRDGFVPSPVA